MNYKKIHDQIIERAKQRVLYEYKEIHHIIPRCMGGTNTIDNLVELTAREHFIVHKLLTKIYPNNRSLNYAFNMMCNRFKLYSISSRYYQEVKQSLTHSTETKKKCSDIKKRWWSEKEDRTYIALYGEEKAILRKQIQSINTSKNMKSEERRKKISDSNRKRVYLPMSDETKQKIREKRKFQDMSYLRGKPRSEETKRKISETKQKNKNTFSNLAAY